MTTVGRWSPNKVRARVLDGTWVDTEELGGMVLMTPTSIAYSGTSATIGANGSVEFSAVTSLSLNGVFTADYDNYMIVIRGTSSVGANIPLRLRANGTDNSTANSYTTQNIQAIGTTVNATRSSADSGIVAVMNATQRCGFVTNIFGPYLSQPTAWRTVTANDRDSARIEDYAVTHNQSVSYDGFTFYPGVGNMTGLISVYGLVGA